MRSELASWSAARIWSACSESTQNTIVFAMRSVRFRYSVRCLAATSVRDEQRDDALEVPRLVEVRRDLAAEQVELALVRLPIRRRRG